MSNISSLFFSSARSASIPVGIFVGIIGQHNKLWYEIHNEEVEVGEE